MHSRYRIVHSLKSLDQTASTGSTHLTAISEVKFKKYIHISRYVWLKVVASWVILHSVQTQGSINLLHGPNLTEFVRSKISAHPRAVHYVVYMEVNILRTK